MKSASRQPWLNSPHKTQSRGNCSFYFFGEEFGKIVILADKTIKHLEEALGDVFSVLMKGEKREIIGRLPRGVMMDAILMRRSGAPPQCTCTTCVQRIYI